MAKVIKDIGKKISRLFLGIVVVKKLGALHRSEPIEVHTHFRGAQISEIRPEPRVSAALFVYWRKSEIKTAGSVLGMASRGKFKVYRVNMKHIEKKCVVKKYRLNISARAAAKNATARMKKMPITRRNRLNFLRNAPKFEKASLLALFSPIFKEKVLRSALDKAGGNLLFWYDNERVKAGDIYHLLLLRVFGGEEPLRWVWLPANKNLNDR